jgi:hypothetical protein
MSEAQRATRYFRSWRVLKDDAPSSEDNDPAQRTTRNPCSSEGGGRSTGNDAHVSKVD